MTHKFVMTAGPTSGDSVELEAGRHVIGRDPQTTQICITTPGVSRQHCAIEIDSSGATISDLGSSNGTFVNGKRIKSPTQLSSGDTVNLGSAVSFAYTAPKPAAPAQTMIEVAPTMMEMPQSDIATVVGAAAAPTMVAAQPAGPHVLVSVGGGEAVMHMLNKDRLTMGRDAGNDIEISSRVVSRQYGAIVKRAGGYVFEMNAGSSNPATINGTAIDYQHQLSHGDSLIIGDFAPEQRVVINFVAPFSKPAISSAADQQTMVAPTPTDATLVSPSSVEDSAKAMAATIVASAAPQAQQPVVPSASPDAMTVIGQMPDLSSLTASGPTQMTVSIAGEALKIYTLTKDSYRIGRAPGNDIVINSRVVSRNHATLEKQGNTYVITPHPDAGNPVNLGGRPVTNPQPLGHEDRMRIGGRDPGLMVTLDYNAPHLAAAASNIKTIKFGEKDQVTIGRDETNDVMLDTPNVSRYHAQIEKVGQRYRIRDLRSSNGTFVNEEQVSGDVWLKAEDTIRIGQHRFVMGADGFEQFDETSGLRVEAFGLNKWVRKDLNILQDISVVFQPREFIVVVGQSGGGKSTLVDSIAGYRPATHGKVTVNDVDVYKNFDIIRNDIGFVPQKDIIHMELTVFQALDYAAQLRMPPDTTKAERHKRIMEVLDDLDLAHRKDVQISGLSGGQQKRVSIGVELITKPGLFFLDEPTSGLDPGTETALMQLMRRLADQGRTIVLITHATKNVMLADKVIFLARGGYLTWFGPPDEALKYFDRYRSERDRRARDIEFDEIYAILDDPSNGTPEEWGKRFREHQAYGNYVTNQLSDEPANVVSKAAEAIKSKTRKSVSGLRQFFILSSRNLKILTRDRFGLFLMLAAAPIVSLLNFVLAAALGRDTYSFMNGSIENTMITLFLPTVYAVMVGGLSQMREIVKEIDIYKRERLVNLKILPYVMSKIWVAVALALYQTIAYVASQYIAFNMPGGAVEFGLMYISLTLATLTGMMLGLFASALAPSPNSAPLIIILLMIPQIVLGGALVPVPDIASGLTGTRWAFQGFMGINGVASDVDADACWDLSAEDRELLTDEQKDANCNCMGENVLNEQSCNFPGVGKNVDTSVVNLVAPQGPGAEPVPPAEPVIPSAPKKPEVPPEPVKPQDESDSIAMAEYATEVEAYSAEVKQIQADFEADLEAYEAEVNQIQDDFKVERTAFEQEVALYKDAQQQFAVEMGEYQAARVGAIKTAEGIIGKLYENFGWLFVEKNSAKYWTMLFTTWIAQGVIMSVLFVAILILQKRKDVI